MSRHALIPVFLMLVLCACGDDDKATIPTDDSPPGVVDDLGWRARTDSSATLVWTAPGDDADSGAAFGYDIRVSTAPLTDVNFAAAALVPSPPAPLAPRQTQLFLLCGLAADSSYFVALRTSDEAHNWSSISNVVTVPARLVCLTTDPSPDFTPDWSPDGSTIAITSARSGNRDIWLVPATGGQAIQLTSDPASDEVPDWSPDGTRIAFASHRGGRSEVWIMSSTGGDLVQLTAGTSYATAPAWSPDGESIAYQQGAEIWIVSAAGGDPTQLTTASEGRYAHTPDWSPDGSTIVCSMWDGSGQHVWSIPVAGGEAIQLTSGEGIDAVPTWSPDGNWIALSTHGAGTTFLRVVSADGLSSEVVYQEPPSPLGSMGHPTWSPDGTYLAVNALRSGNNDIWSLLVQ